MTTIKLLSTGLIAIAMLTTTAVAREKFRGRANARHNTRGTLLYGYMGNSAPARLLDCLARHSNMVRSVGPGRARQHLRRGRQCEDMLRCGGSEARRVVDVLDHWLAARLIFLRRDADLGRLPIKEMGQNVRRDLGDIGQ